MQFFLDTANLEEIKEALSWGVISGLTTNPTLAAKESGSFESLIREICQLLGKSRPVSVEVLSTVSEEMEKEARLLAEVAPNVVIKIPMGVEGLKTVYNLSRTPKPVPCNVTLVFSANQALLAARAGARYVSPFIGRIDDLGWDGVGLVREMADIFKVQVIDTKIIAASIRHPRHVQDVALAGAQIATVPFSVLKQLTRHPLTDLGVERFLADWKHRYQ